MQFADGTPKGARQILIERGLWRRGMSLKEAAETLAAQPDFKETVLHLEELVRDKLLKLDGGVGMSCRRGR